MIDETLSERGTTHGDYKDTARIAQELKRAIGFGLTEGAGHDLPDDMRESLDLICTKIARIVSGNPREPDHWVDIAGYANLIVRELTPAPRRNCVPCLAEDAVLVTPAPQDEKARLYSLRHAPMDFTRQAIDAIAAELHEHPANARAWLSAIKNTRVIFLRQPLLALLLAAGFTLEEVVDDERAES